MKALKKSQYPVLITLILLLILTISATIPQPEVDKRIMTIEDSFSTPESVEYYADEDVYLVGSINGSPLALDGNGFISKVSPDGKVIELKWIDGTKAGVTLNGPKGLEVVGNNLYVADITQVQVFELPSGKQKATIKIEGSTFINGITHNANNDVFVTDSGFTDGFAASGTDAIYKITSDGNYELIAKDKSMGHPNGIVADGEKLIVVTYGSGEIFSIDESGKKVMLPSPPKGGLDGVIKSADGRIIISGWGGSAIYSLNDDNSYTVLMESVDAPADLGYDSKRNRVLIPLFRQNKVVFLDL